MLLRQWFSLREEGRVVVAVVQAADRTNDKGPTLPYPKGMYDTIWLVDRLV